MGEVVALLVRGGRGGVEVDLGTGGRQARGNRETTDNQQDLVQTKLLRIY